MNVQDCKEIWGTQRNLANSRNNICPHQFPDAGVNMNPLLSSLTISPTTFGLAILVVATLATVENFPNVEKSATSNFCDHDEEEDEVGVERYVCQFWLSHSKLCWMVRSNVLCCLVLICIGMWSTPLPCSCWRHISWCFVIFSFPQLSCLRISIVKSHEDHVFITIPLSVKRFVFDVNRGHVVELLDVSFSPPDRHLESSVLCRPKPLLI